MFSSCSPQLGLGGRREDRLGQPRAVDQPGRQRDRRTPRRSRRYSTSPSRSGSRGPRTRPAASRSRRHSHRPARANSAPGRRRVATRWFGTTSASCSNHHSDSCGEDLRPCPGSAVGSTWSKAEIRSVATSSSRPSPVVVELADLARVQVLQRRSGQARRHASCCQPVEHAAEPLRRSAPGRQTSSSRASSSALARVGGVLAQRLPERRARSPRSPSPRAWTSAYASSRDMPALDQLQQHRRGVDQAAGRRPGWPASGRRRRPGP